jgi:hypothetical protein
MSEELDNEDPRWWPRYQLLGPGGRLGRIARQGEDISPEQLRWRAEDTSGLRIVDDGASIVDADSGEPLAEERIREYLANFRAWLDEAAEALLAAGHSADRVWAAVGELYAYADQVERFLAHDPRLDWLVRRVTPEEAAAAHMVQTPALGDASVPFGFLAEQWQKLRTGMRVGDELWEYCSPPETWDELAGRAGYVVVRNGRIVADVLTSMN